MGADELRKLIQGVLKDKVKPGTVANVHCAYALSHELDYRLRIISSNSVVGGRTHKRAEKARAKLAELYQLLMHIEDRPND